VSKRTGSDGVGGTLLAQVTLAATPGPPGGHRPDAPGPAFAVSVTHHVPFGPAIGSEASLAENVLEPVRHRRPAALPCHLDLNSVGIVNSA
jgi:hypothetical protein